MFARTSDNDLSSREIVKSTSGLFPLSTKARAQQPLVEQLAGVGSVFQRSVVLASYPIMNFAIRLRE
jgi:hypothetical protein